MQQRDYKKMYVYLYNTLTDALEMIAEALYACGRMAEEILEDKPHELGQVIYLNQKKEKE